MYKKRVVAVVAAGSLAALGLAGTALAAGADDSTATPSASASVAARGALSVSVEAAKAIALRAAGGGLVESVEREVEHGRAVWDVDVLVSGVEHDIDVDAVSGVVLRHRIEDRARDSRTTSPTPSASAGRHSSDDRGRHAEAGDDRGGRSASKATDTTREARDDHGGREGESGDDRGGRGREAGDDHGSGGHGSDD